MLGRVADSLSSLPQQYDNVTRAVVGTVYYDREKLFTSRIQARFAATENRYNSNVPGNDRSFFRWCRCCSEGIS
jgi:hypothetical protein